MKKYLSLYFIWRIRLKLRAEGDKLWAEGDKLWAEGNKLWAKGKKLRAKGKKLWAEANKLWAEANKLWAEANKLWAEAIIEVYGDTKMEWRNFNHAKNDYECHLGNGEIFKP